jgi:hypothetical protein
MPAPGLTVCGMDTAVILYCSGLEDQALRETAHRFLEAEAARLGVPPDAAHVL